MESSEYQVTIKSANQKVDDYVTKCRSNWTVYRLKQHISETHVNKPNVEDQRLIYAGNLLKDSLTLKQIFFRDSLCTELTNSSKTDFTIHLVCSSNLQRSSTPCTSSQSNANTRPQVSRATQVPVGDQTTTPSTPTSTTTTNQAQPAVNTSTETHPIGNTERARSPIATAAQPNAANTTFTTPYESEIANLMQSDQMRQQIAIFQQLANAVAAQIAQNLISTSINTTNSSSNTQTDLPEIASLLNGQTFNNAGVANYLSGNNIDAASAASQLLYAGNLQTSRQFASSPQEQAARIDQNDNINNANNGPRPQVNLFDAQVQAQAPAADQPAPPQAEQAVPMVEPMMQHDLIDWVYYSIRAFIFMAAISIHASFVRLLVIVGLLAIAFFFNRRRAGPGRQGAEPGGVRAAPPPPEAAPAANGQVPQQQEGGLRRRNVGLQDGDNHDEANRDEVTNHQLGQADAEIAPRRLPFLKLCYLVVTDFLASLVPE